MVILALTIIVFLHINTTRSPFRHLRIWGLFVNFSSPFCLFLFQAKFSHQFFPDRRLLELRSEERPGIGNYKRPRIFRGISHTSNIVTLQTLELLEGWKFWGWEISEVPLY